MDKNRHKPEYTSREVYSLHARYTHSEVELRKCCLGQSAKRKIPYHLIINVIVKFYFRKRAVCTKLDIYVFIKLLYTCAN